MTWDSLSAALQIEDPFDYKVHVARYNQRDEPLDVFVRSKSEWVGWNRWRGKKNEFNRKFILALIGFYPEPKTWLFGGVFKVLSAQGQGENGYEIEETGIGKDLIGRLKFSGEISRGRAFLLETIERKVSVSELLKEKYSGEVFPGFNNISFNYHALEVIFQNERLDWKTALKNVNGVYVIADGHTGKKYVGSAYGGEGIWSRWAAYLSNGHGGNSQLVHLANKTDVNYRRKNFRMTLIESWPFHTDERLILKRESFWKDALLTRSNFGYNSN
ncbi:MAG: GIY-YIG nuclease family protein [Rhizobiaceae bacterium]